MTASHTARATRSPVRKGSARVSSTSRRLQAIRAWHTKGYGVGARRLATAGARFRPTCTKATRPSPRMHTPSGATQPDVPTRRIWRRASRRQRRTAAKSRLAAPAPPPPPRRTLSATGTPLPGSSVATASAAEVSGLIRPDMRLLLPTCVTQYTRVFFCHALEKRIPAKTSLTAPWPRRLGAPQSTESRPSEISAL